MLFMTESCYCSVAYGMRGQACTTPNWRGSPIPIGAEGESQLFCGRNIIWMATAAKQLNGALTIWLSVRCGPTAKSGCRVLNDVVRFDRGGKLPDLTHR